MGNKYLERALPFLKEIDNDRREQFENYFKTAPLWLMETFIVEKMEKGTIFVHEGEPVDMVYFIGKGLIKATDYRIYGIAYDFVLFSKVYAFGGMEIIVGLENYETTLQTVTECIVLKIPKSGFKKWLESDITVLRQESRLMGEYLLEQAKQSRAFLFVQGSNRVALLLVNRYQKYACNGILRIKSDRQELSDFTGLCVKTISRSIKKFKESGLITIEKNDIVINQEQYLRMKEMIAEIFDEN